MTRRSSARSNGAASGRSAAADRITSAGSASRPNEYYFGATGGGLWKTTDGGTTWQPVTDGQIQSSSVGAVAVSESNPDVVYIGMGETELRGNIMQGDGVYKSIDAGKTWKHIGLADTQAISRIRIDPTNPDIVYVAALGHPYGPNAERGVFRSRDGGKTWQKVLYKNDRAGAVDLCIDPHNPRVLYAAIWDVYRTPWTLSSGGPRSGFYKSTDGGDHWTEITRNPGLPQGHHRQDRRRRFGRRFESRLRDGRGRRRRPVPLRTMPAPPGPASMKTGASASARFTTRASTPIRKTATRSTC